MTRPAAGGHYNPYLPANTLRAYHGDNRHVSRRRPPRGLVFHYDRGVQYTGGQFRKLAKGHGFIRSMSRKGDCRDNACAETFFKTLRAELIRRKIYRSREEARRAIFEYVEIFYNRKRLHSYLGYLTPTEYEELEERKTA
jgi:putative transposase